MAQYFVGPEGPIDAQLAIVAEKPGRDELAGLLQTGVGRPLIGTTGKAVDRHLMNIGTHRSKVRLLNAVMEFDNVGTPTTDEIKRGQTRVVRTLREMPNLNCVVAMGKAALLSLSNFHYDEISSRRGSILRHLLGGKMVPTWHPSYYFHGEWRFKSVVEFDLKRALLESRTADRELPTRSYYIEPTFQQAVDWLSSLLGAEWISFDIETFRPAYISCIAFSDDPSRAYCIPIMKGNRQSYWTQTWEEREIWRLIQRVLSQSTSRYVTQNGLFDIWHLYRHGIRVPFISKGFDTMYAHRLVAPDLPHALDFLTSIYTREPYYKDESGKWDSDVRVPDPQFWTYNCKDAAVTLEVAFAMIEDMRELGLYDYFMEHMMPQFDVLLDMQMRGIRVDKERLAATRSRLQEEVRGLEGRLREAVGWIPNTKSYLDMGKLFQQFKVRYNTTKTNRPAIDEESLMLYASRSPAVQDILMACLEITQRRTLLSGFLDMVLDSRGFYHPSYDLSHAVSGRLSSSGAGVY